MEGQNKVSHPFLAIFIELYRRETTPITDEISCWLTNRWKILGLRLTFTPYTLANVSKKTNPGSETASVRGSDAVLRRATDAPHARVVKPRRREKTFQRRRRWMYAYNLQTRVSKPSRASHRSHRQSPVLAGRTSCKKLRFANDPRPPPRTHSMSEKFVLGLQLTRQRKIGTRKKKRQRLTHQRRTAKVS